MVWTMQLARGVGLWVMLQLALRLSLYKPATLALGRVVSLDALSLSAGAFWKLSLGIVLSALPTAAIAIGANLVHTDKLPPWALIVGFAVLFGFVASPIASGFLGAAYRALKLPNSPGKA